MDCRQVLEPRQIRHVRGLVTPNLEVGPLDHMQVVDAVPNALVGMGLRQRQDRIPDPCVRPLHVSHQLPIDVRDHRYLHNTQL